MLEGSFSFLSDEQNFFSREYFQLCNETLSVHTYLILTRYLYAFHLRFGGINEHPYVPTFISSK